jgi:hypothetical protein
MSLVGCGQAEMMHARRHVFCLFQGLPPASRNMRVTSMTYAKNSLTALLVAGFAAAIVLPATAMADDINNRQHISDEGNTKVDMAKAMGWMNRKDTGSAYSALPDSVVNIGSKAKGDCNLNVGGQPSGPGSKDVVVTAKNIINVCQ